MHEDDSDIRAALRSAEINIAPNGARMASARERMFQTPGGTSRTTMRRVGQIAAVLIIGCCGIVFAGTETGRALIRRLIPIAKTDSVRWQAPNGTVHSLSRVSGEAFSEAERTVIVDHMKEREALRQAGEGTLMGLIERRAENGCGVATLYDVAYAYSDNTMSNVCQDTLSDAQAERMRIAEILWLRDEGAGQIVSHREYPLGLGRYSIAYELSDGQTVTLTTYFPPAPRKEREAIMAETLRLRNEGLFHVANPRAVAGDEVLIYAKIRYELADGRIVWLTEQVPPQYISEDGQYVVLPNSEENIPISQSD
jgi:hypothetical protein